MSAGSVAASTDATGALQSVGRHWRLAAFVVLGFGPFLPSIVAMRQFFLADNALGFVPFVIVIAAISFWSHSFSEIPGGRRDLIVDAFIALPMALLAIYTLRYMPGYLSWYFWLFRVDLLALPLFLVAAGVVCFGYQRVLAAAPAYATMFLIWPYPIVRIQQYLIDPFINLTTVLTGWAVRFFSLPYVQDPAAPEHFVSQHLATNNFDLVIAQACAGTATFIAFGLFALASSAFTRGPWMARVRWIACGLLLAVVFNFIRIVVLLFTAVTFSEHVAVDVVHPILGVALFALEVVLMLLLVRPFGLRFDRMPRGHPAAWTTAGNGGGRALAVLTAITLGAAIGVGALDARAQAFSFLDLGEGAPTVNLATDQGIAAPVAGWTVEHVAPLDWTDLFGRTSRGDVFTYQASDGGPGIVLQSIVTEDKATLDRYPVEQCVVFHFDHVDGVRTVQLPSGTTGSLVRSSDGQLWSSALSWEFPVQVDGEIWHARAVLLLDTEEPMRAIPDRPEVRVLARDLGTSLDAPPPGANLEQQRAHVDLQLASLASQMIDALVAPSEPVSAAAGG